MPINIRKCTEEDLSMLREISYETFNETFSSSNSPERMMEYLEQAFNLEKMKSELADNHSAFYFLYTDNVLAGYLKINESVSQTDIHDSKSIEIERIYVKKEFQAKGFGYILLNKAVEYAKEMDKAYVWLGVWEKNDKALKFYKKNGFYKVAEHPFYIGEEKQTDYVMRKNI